MQLNPFTKDDWSAYAGCISEAPLLGQAGDLEVVVDDRWVSITHMGNDPPWLNDYEFPDPSLALLFAMEIRGTEPFDILGIRADMLGCTER